MIKLFDKVRIVESGLLGIVIEIDDDNGNKPPSYLVEIEETPEWATVPEVISWYDWREIEKL